MNCLPHQLIRLSKSYCTFLKWNLLTKSCEGILYRKYNYEINVRKSIEKITGAHTV